MGDQAGTSKVVDPLPAPAYNSTVSKRQSHEGADCEDLHYRGLRFLPCLRLLFSVPVSNGSVIPPNRGCYTAGRAIQRGSLVWEGGFAVPVRGRRREPGFRQHRRLEDSRNIERAASRVRGADPVGPGGRHLDRRKRGAAPTNRSLPSKEGEGRPRRGLAVAIGIAPPLPIGRCRKQADPRLGRLQRPAGWRPPPAGGEASG